MISMSNMLSFTLNIYFKLVAFLLYRNISMSNTEHPAILIIYNCGLEKMALLSSDPISFD